jgi:hypothetical protein
MQSIFTLRKRAFLIVALIVFSSCHHASSPKVNFSGHWTNGLEDYKLDAATDSTWVFPGGNFHEGGLSFGVKLNRYGQYIICPASEIDTNYRFQTDPNTGKIGDKIVYKEVDTSRIILIESRKGDIHDVLLNIDTTVELVKFYERNRVEEYLRLKMDLIYGMKERRIPWCFIKQLWETMRIGLVEMHS